MTYADILNIVNLGSATVANTSGAGVDVSRITRKSVFVQVQAGSNVTVNIDASPNNTEWWTIDTKAYSSGAAIQRDIFSYLSHIPYIRTAVTNISGTTVSTIITGRGV